MNRRQFISTSIGLLTPLAGIVAGSGRSASTPYIMTVKGKIPAAEMGLTLPHEHMLVDFIGADQVSPSRYDAEEVYRHGLPFLEEIVARGCNTFIECTPAYLGRDAGLLRRWADATGLHILTNTGYYGAVNDKCLPPHAFTDTVDELAARWVREWTDGIGGSGIRPGLIKIGVDKGALSEIDRKLIHAAARTHRATGLTIAAHTGEAVPAYQQLEVLEEEGVAPDAWIWIHAQNEQNPDRWYGAADRGAWISLDNISSGNTERYVRSLLGLREAGMLHRVLVSHDAGWYRVGEPGGGAFRPFTALFDTLVPALLEEGFSRDDLDVLLKQNPAEAFAVRVRAAA